MSKSILGIDVSKKELMVALLLPGNSISIQKKEFASNKQGFQNILNWLQAKTVDQVKVCMEAIGNYGTKLADFLYDKVHEVNVINPLFIKAFSNSKLVSTKTDVIDQLLL